MKNQFLLALFLGILTSIGSIKIKSFQSCDPIGIKDVVVSYTPGTIVNKVLASDIGANGNKVFVCSMIDKKVYEYDVDNKVFKTVIENINLPCKSISVDIMGNPWYLTETGAIYRLKNKTESWEKINFISGEAVDLACSKYGDCFFSDKDNKLYRIDIKDNRVISMDNGLKSIDASMKLICGSNKNSEVLCRNALINGGNWNKLSGAAIDIAICKNEQIYVVGTDFNIWKHNGSNWTSVTTSRNLVKVACDSKLYYIADGTVIEFN